MGRNYGGDNGGGDKKEYQNPEGNWQPPPGSCPAGASSWPDEASCGNDQYSQLEKIGGQAEDGETKKIGGKKGSSENNGGAVMIVGKKGEKGESGEEEESNHKSKNLDLFPAVSAKAVMTMRVMRR